MYPLDAEFKSGQGVNQIKADWLNTVSNMLNGLEVIPVADLKSPVVVPPGQSGKNWQIHIPAAGTGSGLPDGSEETPHAIWNTSTEEWEAGLILQPGTKHGQLAYWDATLAKWELIDAGSKDQLLKTNSSGKPEWTTGFTGTINRVTKIELVGLDLKQTKVTDTYTNGLLISSTDPEETTIFTFENCVESPS